MGQGYCCLTHLNVSMSFSDEYVICLGCKSPDTILSKENRLFFLRCEKVTADYPLVSLLWLLIKN
jgi:translation initiation factor 2 beta subunit (eIF-2beta)/eIF-5